MVIFFSKSSALTASQIESVTLLESDNNDGSPTSTSSSSSSSVYETVDLTPRSTILRHHQKNQKLRKQQGENVRRKPNVCIVGSSFFFFHTRLFRLSFAASDNEVSKYASSSSLGNSEGGFRPSTFEGFSVGNSHNPSDFKIYSPDRRRQIAKTSGGSGNGGGGGGGGHFGVSVDFAGYPTDNPLYNSKGERQKNLVETNAKTYIKEIVPDHILGKHPLPRLFIFAVRSSHSNDSRCDFFLRSFSRSQSRGQGGRLPPAVDDVTRLLHPAGQGRHQGGGEVLRQQAEAGGLLPKRSPLQIRHQSWGKEKCPTYVVCWAINQSILVESQ